MKMKIVRLSIMLLVATSSSLFAQNAKKATVVPAQQKTVVAVEAAENNTYGLDAANFALVTKQVKSIADVLELSDDKIANLTTNFAAIQNRLAAINAGASQNPDAAQQVTALEEMKSKIVLNLLTPEQIQKAGGELRVKSLVSAK
jgi:hypothetical protein